MRRRDFLKAGAAAAAALASPALVAQERKRVLKFVPQTDVAGLDPIWTPTYPARDHSLMVFDTLYGQDDSYRAQPQMVEGAVTESDGKVWKLTLRPGLLFHDGTPVLARDCAASIRRWGRRDPFGEALMAATDELSAADDRTIVFRLKRPFPLLPDALGKSYPRLCVMMPERLANTDPFTQITEMVGSGPFRFVAKERVAGSRMVYERFEGYVPRPSGTAEWTAGPKVVHFDRVEWTIIPDQSTAFSALKSGEVDWWWTPDSDLLPSLRSDRNVTVRIADPTGQIGTLRFNHLNPPFNNPALRRAVLRAVSQRDFMTAIVGEDPALWREGVGFFCPETPYASKAGLEALTAPRDLAAVQREIKAAGYDGGKTVILAPTDIPNLKMLGDICADMLGKIGFNVDYQAMGWGALVQRRFKEDPVERGGWSVFNTSWGGLDQTTPAGHAFLRGNGKPTGPGWPTSEKIESLRGEWLAATTEADQKRLAEQLQLQAFQDVPYAPLGQYFLATAYRSDLTGMLNGVPAMWNVRRTG